MKKIIVLGATGNIGSYFTKYAIDYFKGKFEIVASGRRKKADVFKQMGVDYISVDISKKEEFEKLPTKDVYAIVDVASQVPIYTEKFDGQLYLDSVVQGTYNVLEYCRKTKVEKLLYAHTCFDIWEYPRDKMITPDIAQNYSYTGDHAFYVICKNTALELMEHYHQQYGLKKFIFRMPSIYSYSPNQYFTFEGVRQIRPIYKLINNAINSKPLEIWGNPDYKKDMTHVYDLSQMYCKAIENQTLEKGFYNGSSGFQVSLMEQMQAIIKVFSPPDNPSEIVVLRDKPKGEGGIVMDIQNAKDELGYEPKYDIVKLFEDFKEEMKVNRFLELRGKE